MIVLTTRVHPDITTARRLRRWRYGLALLVTALVGLLIALPWAT